MLRAILPLSGKQSQNKTIYPEGNLLIVVIDSGLLTLMSHNFVFIMKRNGFTRWCSNWICVIFLLFCVFTCLLLCCRKVYVMLLLCLLFMLLCFYVYYLYVTTSFYLKYKLAILLRCTFCDSNAFDVINLFQYFKF